MFTHSEWARLYTHINLASLASHTFAKVWLGRLYLAASRFIYDLLQGHKQAYSPLDGWLVAPATLAPRREARMVLETRQIAQPWNNKVKGGCGDLSADHNLYAHAIAYAHARVASHSQP